MASVLMQLLVVALSSSLTLAKAQYRGSQPSYPQCPTTYTTTTEYTTVYQPEYKTVITTQYKTEYKPEYTTVYETQYTTKYTTTTQVVSEYTTETKPCPTQTYPPIPKTDSPAAGGKCGIPQPVPGCCGRPFLERQVSEETQKLFDALKQQVKDALNGFVFPDFIVDCYLQQLVAGMNYDAQITINVETDYCIRVTAFLPLYSEDLVFGGVEDHQHCKL